MLDNSSFDPDIEPKSPEKSKTDFALLLVTVPSESDARLLATDMVEEGLAGCVNVIPNLTSIYRWKDELQTETEALLMIKTTRAAVPALESWILKNHPYDIPEFVIVPIESVTEAYGQWLARNIKLEG
jgi:periplasmic divalent cation tolerance protein